MGANREESAAAAGGAPTGVPEGAPSAAALHTAAQSGDGALSDMHAASLLEAQHRTALPDATETLALCANCGTPVARHYCPECGQRVEHAVHSLWHFILEIAEDLTHADSRLWRTMLALLFKPGYLTSEFLAGRRVRYLPPLRLYLVLSVLYFLVDGLLHPHHQLRVVQFTDDNGVTVAPAPKAVPRPGETPQQFATRVCTEQVNYAGPWVAYVLPILRSSCEKSVADGGRQLAESFIHNIPRALFLAVPLLALVMKPLYSRPRRYYVEHLLFLLHEHAFLFLLFGLFSLAVALLQVHLLVRTLAIAVGLYIPYYYYAAMRRVYGQGLARTFGKLVVLSLAYFMTGILVFAGTTLYSVLAQ
jgi:hypothetical protein